MYNLDKYDIIFLIYKIMNLNLILNEKYDSNNYLLIIFLQLLIKQQHKYSLIIFFKYKFNHELFKFLRYYKALFIIFILIYFLIL